MNALDIPRRLFLGSAVGALALRPSRRAQADTAFTNFRFAATGAPAARTMPDRLSDVINVKDWGAVGNNTGDDSTAIQNAIDYCISLGGGKVFFPPGKYFCTNLLSVGSNSDPTARVELVGGGMDNTLINMNNSSGFMFSKGARTYDSIGAIEGFRLNNSAQVAGSGLIRITNDNVTIRHCYLFGMCLVDASAANGASIISVSGGCTEIYGDATTPFATQAVGMYLGPGCTALTCRVQNGCFIAYALSGPGASCISCGAEGHNIACRVGWAPSGSVPHYPGTEVQAIGCTVQNLQTEQSRHSIELYNAQGCFISSNATSGLGGYPPNAQNLTSGSYSWSSGSGGVATITTPAAHHISGAQYLLLNPYGGGAATLGSWRPNLFTFCTPTDSTHFTYPLASNPGSAPPGGYWTYALADALRCRIVTETAIIAGGINVTGLNTVDLDYAGEAQHRNNVFVGTPGDFGWIMPSVRGNLGGWYFSNVGQARVRPDAVNTTPGPHGQMRYADLPGVFTPPGGQIYYQDAIEGQEYDIVDGSPNNAAWGQPIGGGSNGRFKVRRNNNNQWVRIG